MTPLQLRYFVEIARGGSLSVAAAKLHITQPSLSHHLATLEQELGVTLVMRQARGIALTTEGRRLYEKAVDLLGQFKGIPEYVKQGGGVPQGVVKLCLADSVAAALTGQILTETQERYPKVKLIISTAMSEQAKQLIQKREVDLALLPNASEIPGLTIVHARQEAFALYFSTAHWKVTDAKAVPFRDAIELPLAIPTHRYDIRRQLERQAAEIRRKLNIAYEIDNAEVGRSLVRAGLACGIWPARGWPEALHDKAIGMRRLVEPVVERTLSIAWNQDQFQGAANDVIRQLLLELLERDIEAK